MLAVLITPLFVSAQVGGNQPNTSGGYSGNQSSGGGIITIHNPFNCKVTPEANCTFINLLTAILENVVMPIVSVVVVVWIIWAGFTYVLAQGNPEELKKAHKRLLWSLVGAGILLGAEAISKVVQNTVTSLITH